MPFCSTEHSISHGLLLHLWATWKLWSLHPFFYNVSVASRLPRHHLQMDRQLLIDSSLFWWNRRSEERVSEKLWPGKSQSTHMLPPVTSLPYLLSQLQQTYRWIYLGNQNKCIKSSSLPLLPGWLGWISIALWCWKYKSEFQNIPGSSESGQRIVLGTHGYK